MDDRKLREKIQESITENVVTACAHCDVCVSGECNHVAVETGSPRKELSRMFKQFILAILLLASYFIRPLCHKISRIYRSVRKPKKGARG